MNAPARLDNKIQQEPTVNYSSRHNPALIGEITRIARNTLFMHFVLLKHHVYIF